MIVPVSPGKTLTRTVPKRTLRCWRRAGSLQPENRVERPYSEVVQIHVALH